MTTDEALRRLVAYVLTCEMHNTVSWMHGLVEHINEACEALNDDDRFDFVADILRGVTHIERRES